MKYIWTCLLLLIACASVELPEPDVKELFVKEGLTTYHSLYEGSLAEDKQYEYELWQRIDQNNSKVERKKQWKDSQSGLTSIELLVNNTEYLCVMIKEKSACTVRNKFGPGAYFIKLASDSKKLESATYQGVETIADLQSHCYLLKQEQTRCFTETGILTKSSATVGGKQDGIIAIKVDMDVPEDGFVLPAPLLGPEEFFEEIGGVTLFGTSATSKQ